MERQFLVTPLKIFISSGLRALNSIKTNALCSMLEDASVEASAGQQCKSGVALLAQKFSNNQYEAEASDTEHQWACKDVLETIEAVPYHEVFIHNFGDYDTCGLQPLVYHVNDVIPLYSLGLLVTKFAENQGIGYLRDVYIQNNFIVLGSVVLYQVIFLIQ